LDALQAVIDRLPEQAGRVRRRYWRDPGFRGVCDDYREALAVVERLERTTPRPTGRLDEYRELATDLLAEVTEMITRETDRGNAKE
jgi:hypothetical protein